MARDAHEESHPALPVCATAYIARVTKQMRYRRRARAEVGAELTAHFEDALADCTDSQQREAIARALIEQFGDAKLLAVLCRRAKKRCRPWWLKVIIRSAQAVGIVFLYSVLCSLPLWIGQPVVRVNYVDWLNERWRPTQPSAENARDYFDKAAKLYVEPPEALAPKINTWRRDSAEWFADCNEAEMQQMKRWLADNAPAFDMLRRAVQIPHYWPAYHISETDLGNPNFFTEAYAQLPGYREVALALRDQIALEASLGDLEQALNDCLVLWTFGRRMQGKGLLNDQLVGVAIEALGCDSVPVILDRCAVAAPVLARVSARMKPLVDPHRPAINFDGEEVFWFDRIQRTFTDDGQGGGRALRRGIPYAAGGWMDNLLGVLVFDYPDRRDAQEAVERYFAQVECDQLRPPFEQALGSSVGEGSLHPAPNAMSNLTAPSYQNPLLNLLVPAHRRVMQLAWRMKTGELATQTIVAVLRYRAERDGYPATLDQLVETGYLDALPDDPFGTGPLSYRQTDDGFLLYSWGENLRDDGGQQGTDRKGKPRMWSDNGDWVFWPVDGGRP